MNAPKLAIIPQNIVEPPNGVLAASVQIETPDRMAEPAWKAFMRHRSAVAGVVTLLLLVLAALSAPLLFPRRPSFYGCSGCYSSVSARRLPIGDRPSWP